MWISSLLEQVPSPPNHQVSSSSTSAKGSGSSSSVSVAVASVALSLQIDSLASAATPPSLSQWISSSSVPSLINAALE